MAAAIRCRRVTSAGVVSNMSMSYIWAATDVCTVPLSCHCQLVLCAGTQQPGHATGAGSARAAAEPLAAASRQSAVSRQAARRRIPPVIGTAAAAAIPRPAVRPVQSAVMIITTTNDLPGYEIEEVLGEVFGLTVRSRNVGSQIGAGLKSIMGGELRGMTKALVESRTQVTERMVEEAEARGGNAILAMRFDTSEMGGTWTEICAYGTAVRVRKL